MTTAAAANTSHAPMPCQGSGVGAWMRPLLVFTCAVNATPPCIEQVSAPLGLTVIAPSLHGVAAEAGGALLRAPKRAAASTRSAMRNGRRFMYGTSASRG